MAALLASMIALPAEASARPTVRIPTTPVLSVSIARYWYAEEMFYLGLVNCTRTGGWVLSDGSCKGYGTGRYSKYVAPLRYSAGMSDLVSRPYARLLTVKNLCTHFYGGTPLDRMRRAGYTRITNWGENIGCRTASYARTAVLLSHLYFQSEKSYNGGHWRNMKNSAFHYVGIGVWKYGTRVRLVVDFYA
jgi:cysteine-rich secretory family protein